MARQAKRAWGIRASAGEGLLAASLSVALAWVFLARLSSLLLWPAPDVAGSESVSLASAVALLVGLPVAWCLGGSEDGGRGWLAIPGVAGCLLAVVTNLLPFAAAGLDATWPALDWVVGVLLGLALACGAVVALRIFAAMGLRSSLLPLSMAWMPATVLYVVLGGLMPARVGFVAAILPPVSLGLLVLATRRGIGFGAGSRDEAEGAGDAVVSGGFRLAGATSRRLPAGSRAGAASRDLSPTLSRAPWFGLLLVVSGALCSYMANMYPKTTNCAPAFLDPSLCLGTLSWRCVVALLVGGIMLWVTAALSDRRRADVPAVGAVALLVFAAMFFFLPSMKSGAFAFMLVMPCSALMALLVVALAVRRCSGRLGGGWWRAPCGSLMAMACGGLASGTFAYLFMGPLYDLLGVQDLLFSLIPALLIVCEVALLLMFGDDCRALFFPSPRSSGRRMEASAESRCALLAATYGLTPRESEVLALVAEGRNEPYIERSLGISRTTVKTHVTHIYRKAGVSSRQELLDLLHDPKG